MVTAIADGDLEPRPLPAGRDELGDLGQALTTTRSRILAQEEELARSRAVRDEQLRVSFQHQRQAEIRLRDRAQTAISTSTSTEQIAATIAELERDTAQMTTTIAAMVSGIAGVGAAATSLRAVAADQGAVVGRLAGQMGETFGRVDRMSGLSAQLERREADRVTATGTIRVRRGTEVSTPAIIDVSRGGIRVRLDPDTLLRTGDSVEIENLGPAGDPIRVQARVINTGGDDGEAGLQFLVATTARPSASTGTSPD